MPAYEYRCLDCKRIFEVFISYEEYGEREITCPHCESAKVQKRLSRVRIAKSEDQRFEDMADPSALEGLEDDPQALGRMMRKMSSEMGEDLGPEFDEVVDRLEKGQSPDDIEKAIPDLGGADGGMGGMDDFSGDF
ncbi:MAG: zinc ribbon domain-containing protein [Anaerolineales bacterium]|nr:zinc ribbon domain-containing protein [Anaerolineales bacterium]